MYKLIGGNTFYKSHKFNGYEQLLLLINISAKNVLRSSSAGYIFSKRKIGCIMLLRPTKGILLCQYGLNMNSWLSLSQDNFTPNKYKTICVQQEVENADRSIIKTITHKTGISLGTFSYNY